MDKADIRNRDDIRLLVNHFYAKIRIDPVLGPIFNSIIDDWDSHLNHLTDFWEGQLFLKRKYLGNPLAVHQQVDRKIENGITPEHFGLWLNLWYKTLEELFEGEVTGIARTRARKMSTMFYQKIFENRNS